MGIIYANGTQEIAITATYQLTVSSDDKVKIFKKLGFPNQPDSWAIVTETTPGTNYTTAVYAAGATLRVEAGAAPVYYSQAVDAVRKPLTKQAAAVAKADADASVTAEQLIAGICVHTVTTGRTLTTPTGAAITAGCQVTPAPGDSFEFTLISIGAGADDISTLTAGDGDVTIVGTATVGPSGSTFNNFGTFRFRCTSAGVWVAYRIG